MTHKPSYEELEQINLSLEKRLSEQEEIVEEHKKNRDRHRQFHRMLELMTHNAPDLIWAKDDEDQYLFANQAICDKLLMSESTREPIGKTDLFFCHREREKGFKHTFGEICVDSDAIVKQKQKPQRFLEDGLVRNQYLALDVHKAPFYNETGEMIGTVGCGRDVTNEIEISRKLKKSEGRFRNIIEEVSEISILGYDQDRKMIFWNTACEKLYGYTRQEALGQRLEDLIIPEEMHEDIKDAHSQWITRGIKIPSGEITLKDKSGKPVPVFSSHVMHDTPSGKEMFCIDIDMGPVRQAENEKKHLEDQLRQAQKMESIGTLTGGIAHDFNNILQAISGFADLMLMDRKEGDPDFQNLEEISNAAERAGNLISQLLLFSRKAPTEKKSLGINREVEQATRLLDKTIPKMIEIKTGLTPVPWTIHADPVQIQQVILNLVGNAADAMPQGGYISITTSNITLDESFTRQNLGSAPGDYLCLSISDTGCGMEQETLKKIFEPFFTTKEAGKGTGLGLSSVYGIVKQHGGYITCESRPKKGSVFKIYLPALEDDNICLDKDEIKVLSGTESILVVDDEKPIQTFVTRTLQRFGYTAIPAYSGEAALEIYEKDSHGIDLVLLDFNMPGMGGHRCLKGLFKINPRVKIITASGYLDENDFKNNDAKKAVDHIKKPYRINELLDKLRKALG